jgi:hypothetical protein
MEDGRNTSRARARVSFQSVSRICHGFSLGTQTAIQNPTVSVLDFSSNTFFTFVVVLFRTYHFVHHTWHRKYKYKPEVRVNPNLMPQRPHSENATRRALHWISFSTVVSYFSFWVLTSCLKFLLTSPSHHKHRIIPPNGQVAPATTWPV